MFVWLRSLTNQFEHQGDTSRAFLLEQSCRWESKWNSPMNSFRNKRNTVRGILLFSFLLELPEYHCTYTMLLGEIRRLFPKTPVERTNHLIPKPRNNFFSMQMVALENCTVLFAENSYRFFHANEKTVLISVPGFPLVLGTAYVRLHFIRILLVLT